MPSLRANVALSPPPPLQRGDALFLDVDGTLLELAPTPREVQTPPGLVTGLGDLSQMLGGAVAVVSGRSLVVVDQLLAPWKPPGAGVHGAELRFPGSPAIRRHEPVPESVGRCLRTLFAQVPEVLVEDKASAIALHFARCPQRAEECERALSEAIQGLPGLRIQRGRAVIEAVHSDANKGAAVDRLLRHAPFKGRRPVFVGDDRTDEAAFALLRSLDGIGVKVGEGATQASYRLPHPAAVRHWLAECLAELSSAQSAGP